jgi:phosphate:Na+ symporter
MEELKSVEWMTMMEMMLGGISLFLFGMKTISELIKAHAGESLRNSFQRVGSSKFLGCTVGVLMTAFLQSSSLVCLLNLLLFSSI